MNLEEKEQYQVDLMSPIALNPILADKQEIEPVNKQNKEQSINQNNHQPDASDIGDPNRFFYEEWKLRKQQEKENKNKKKQLMTILAYTGLFFAALIFIGMTIVSSFANDTRSSIKTENVTTNYADQTKYATRSLYGEAINETKLSNRQTYQNNNIKFDLGYEEWILTGFSDNYNGISTTYIEELTPENQLNLYFYIHKFDNVNTSSISATVQIFDENDNFICENTGNIDYLTEKYRSALLKVPMTNLESKYLDQKLTYKVTFQAFQTKEKYNRNVTDFTQFTDNMLYITCTKDESVLSTGVYVIFFDENHKITSIVEKDCPSDNSLISISLDNIKFTTYEVYLK